MVIEEAINTADDNVAVRLFHRMMLVQEAYQYSPPENGSRLDWTGSGGGGLGASQP